MSHLFLKGKLVALVLAILNTALVVSVFVPPASAGNEVYVKYCDND